MHSGTAILVATGALAIAACSPGAKAPDAPATADTAAKVPADATTVPADAAPASLFDGLTGVDRIPATLLPQMATETAPHWSRCGDEMVTEVMTADGKPEGFIVARGVGFTFVDAPIDVPSQKAGETVRRGVNLRSNTYVQYFGEGVTHTDISGREVTKAGWSREARLTAPLPFWQTNEIGGVWQAKFRRNAADSANWQQRYRSVDCAAVPPRP